MNNVYKPKHVCIAFKPYCQDCPYSEIEVFEEIGEGRTITCEYENICQRVYDVVKDEIDTARYQPYSVSQGKGGC